MQLSLSLYAQCRRCSGFNYVDFSRAFDNMDHTILCRKLFDFGLDSSYVSWFADLLSDRKYFVILGLSLSQVHFVPLGVLLGKIMGPKLFNSFISDLPIKLILFPFADDVKI